MRKNILLEALDASRKAIFKEKEIIIETKGSAADLLTNADLAAERAARKVIDFYTNDQFISEEDPDALSKASDKDFTGWIIDPIDGTNNFSRGISYFAISLAYVERGIPIIGGVIDPISNETWLAEKDKGAIRNHKPIKVGDKNSFDPGTRVCTSNSYEEGLTEINIRRANSLGPVWIDVLNSAVLNLAYVADGRIDVYQHNGFKPWDLAAALLIAEEAGAVALKIDGNKASFRDSEMVIANKDLAQLFLEKIN
jgi:myo-inositol-1(or 4)-monophosphatase